MIGSKKREAEERDRQRQLEAQVVNANLRHNNAKASVS